MWGEEKTCVPGHACLRSPEAASPSRPAAVLHKFPHKLPSLFICTTPIVKVSHIYGLRVAGTGPSSTHRRGRIWPPCACVCQQHRGVSSSFLHRLHTPLETIKSRAERDYAPRLLEIIFSFFFCQRRHDSCPAWSQRYVPWLPPKEAEE